MNYEFSFYQEEDFDDIEALVLLSYQWDYPTWGLSRHEFTKGLHPAFTGHHNAWQHSVGVYKENGKIVACVINEGNYDGEVFFLFDSKKRGEDKPLIMDMIKFAKTYCAAIKEDRRTRYVNICIPQWHTTLRDMVLESGFVKTDHNELCYILPFKEQPFEVKLPHGYTFADGDSTPDFYLANIHRLSFAYKALEQGEQAFRDLRKMKHYRKHLDLCVLDEQKRPVAFAIIWHDDKMPYCELEPLAVVWWERRKGIGTALLHEASNRIKEQFPNCQGMLGGDQTFYSRIGFEKKAEIPQYHWEIEVFISWEKESLDKNYNKEV